MNSEVTLTNYSTSQNPKGQIRLLFKRSDAHHAVLYEHNVPRFYLTTSDGFSKVKIRDEARRKVVAEVNRRTFLRNIFKFVERNDGKAVNAAHVLKQAPTTNAGQLSMSLHTEQGTYLWRKKRSYSWALYEESSDTPVVWMETISGAAPTWELVVESQASSILDYVLASLFYLKATTDCTEAGKAWESVDGRVLSLTII
ncbi:hypothetical protein D9756_008834 [Leucocoprinus leucothites]|uniref:DUF6593 domain-containing protein n=1 Tax=Leucocoprinus leucothites TaxID=201217 RepID=A0A8H5CX86_9AGAR|nr:hypothetical protein D9756_008834 [Leucoagaricus leucothites]